MNSILKPKPPTLGAEASQRATYPSLRGKRVLITGGASGIGAGIVEAFVAQDAAVTFLDILDEEATTLVARFEAVGARPPAYRRCDLTDPAQIEAALAAVGPLDVLVNNAGNDDRHTVEQVTADYWDNRIAVNLRHMLLCARAAAPGMGARGGGAIVNLGSISWHLGLKDLVVYETAKAGVVGMTRALARELGEQAIRVACVTPGNVLTPRQQQWYTPEGEAEIVAAQCLKLRVEPRDVAAMILFLASDEGRACTGHEYWVDAGWA